MHIFILLLIVLELFLTSDQNAGNQNRAVSGDYYGLKIDLHWGVKPITSCPWKKGIWRQADESYNFLRLKANEVCIYDFFPKLGFEFFFWKFSITLNI